MFKSHIYSLIKVIDCVVNPTSKIVKTIDEFTMQIIWDTTTYLQLELYSAIKIT